MKKTILLCILPALTAVFTSCTTVHETPATTATTTTHETVATPAATSTTTVRSGGGY